MTRRLLSHRWLALAAVAFAPIACDGSIGLPPATANNLVDTVTLYALNGTQLGTPSGFDIVNRESIRVEHSEPFDFAFDLDSTGTAVLMPSTLLGAPSAAGFLTTGEAFDDLRKAPLDGYVMDSTLAITAGATFLARSRSSSGGCSLYVSALPRYGKFRVLGVDAVTRTIELEFLVNQNCGYRSLEPGVPSS